MCSTSSNKPESFHKIKAKKFLPKLTSTYKSHRQIAVHKSTLLYMYVSTKQDTG